MHCVRQHPISAAVIGIRRTARRRCRPILMIGGLWSVAGCESGPEVRAYVETLGTDTTAVEAFTRTSTGLDGTILVRTPVTRVARYRGTFGADGRITELEVDWTTPPENPDGPAPQHFSVTLEGDSATVARGRGDEVETLRVAVTPETVVSTGKIPVSVAIFEQAARQASVTGQAEYPFSVLAAPGRRAAPNRIVRRGEDSVSMEFFGNPMLARLDEEGRIVGVTGNETTMKILTQPTYDVDVERLAAEFAARDARGEGLGVPSPGDTVEVRSAGATFEVIYSRPAKRGRAIFGGLVPWNEVWRTGANAATQFATDRNLTVGDERVPAGTYTLWTTYTLDTATLIINSETGQWGTAYDASRDFVRVNLNRETLTDPVERFTIDITPTDNGGVLQLMWDAAKFSVPLRVR